MRRAAVAGLGLLGLRRLYRLLARGALTIDTGIGRRVRALGPVDFEIAAPREVVFDVIATPYLGRTPRALEGELEVLERGSDMVLAAHFTQVNRLTWQGELGTDFWSVGAWWGGRVARQWDRAVRRSLVAITAEAERRAR